MVIQLPERGLSSEALQCAGMSLNELEMDTVLHIEKCKLQGEGLPPPSSGETGRTVDDSRPGHLGSLRNSCTSRKSCGRFFSSATACVPSPMITRRFTGAFLRLAKTASPI